MSTQSGNAYVVHDAQDTGDSTTLDLLEETFIASHQTVNLNPTLQAHAETLNGGIPGPIIRVKKDQSFVIRLKNDLDHATGLHWHGIEMANKKDGTPFTQNDVPPGGTYLYKLHAPREGLFWYHPHSHTSTNQTFRGMYGAIVVTDEDVESALGGVLPADTLALVLSDTTVCRTPGQNNTETYPAGNPWAWAGPGGVFPGQPGPFPIDICELETLDDHGEPTNPVVPYQAGDIPNIQPKGPVTPGAGRVNEGQTVLTNGIQVEHRLGTHLAPDPQFNPTSFHPVTPGQGLRLQIFNCSTTRYVRLHLSSPGFSFIPLFRIGGEGGLLEHPIQETDLKTASIPEAFTPGEILLPAGSRADVVAVIPQGLAFDEVLTLWTLDYPRLGGQQWCNLPTVPVAHFKNNNAQPQSFVFDEQINLRPNGPAIKDLKLELTQSLLDPSTFSKPGKTVPPLDVIELQAGGGTTKIDGQIGDHDLSGPYSIEPHIPSARYAKSNDVLELRVKNSTQADHPFHLHGFSIQPIELVSNNGTGPTYTWNFLEYRDNINVPAQYTLTFRVWIEPRHLVDDSTPGGEMGRWLFHCHIFFHAHLGMMSELVILPAASTAGEEKPCIDVGGSWAYSDNSQPATRHGTYAHPDGVQYIDYQGLTTFTVTDSAPPSTLTHQFTANPPGPNGGTWDWQGTSNTDGIYYVYVKVTDTRGYEDQCVFRVQFGPTDQGADNGDPHIHTLDGKRYDFQAAGEFTLLRDLEEGFEIQARQTPVRAANPVTDDYTGLRSCVSVNTAVAVRAGRRVVSYQPWRDSKELRTFLDGKPFEVPSAGIALGEHWLSMPTIGDAVSMRIDFASGAVLIARPWFWDSYGVWLFNIDVTSTGADEGIMAPIPKGTWLPRLRSGGTVGPTMPKDLDERYVALYRTFADSWRVTDKTSLFVYEPDRSTRTYTDREWPAFEPPCRLQPQFEVPGANPPKKGLTIPQAEKICALVKDKGLNQDCVFDVATTGDKELARAYERTEALRRCATRVRVNTDRPRSKPGEEVVVTASVTNVVRDAGEAPFGSVTFIVDDREAGERKLDERGQAKFVLRGLDIGEHRVRALYTPGGECRRESSSSPIRTHLVARARRDAQPEDQLLPHVLKVAAPGGAKKHTEVDLDVKTARRILAFVNDANRPEDLMQPPEVRKHLHVEYRKRGYPERHAPVVDAHESPKHEPKPGPGTGPHGPKHTRHAKPETETLRTLAVEVLQKRNEQPILGFTSIRQLLDLDRLRALLELWFSNFSRATKGEWSGPYTIPGGAFDRPVHAALLRTGKVLFWGLSSGKNPWVWTPSGAAAGTAAVTANKPGDSLFCAGHVFLTDGRLLVVGGGGDGTGPRHNHGWIFDPATETWTRTANDMHFHRWYPTLVMMGDTPGRVLVVSGDDTSGTDVAQMEMYFETTDTFELVWGPGGAGDTSANHSFPQIYPAMNLLPGGEVFYTPTGWHSGGCSGASDYPAAKPSGFYDFSSTTAPIKATWSNIGTQDAAAEAAIDRVKGMAVLLLQPSYPFVQMLVVGGGKDPESATSFQMINLSTCTPKWGPPVTLPDGLARVNVNLVALPDGTVFVSGGRPSGGTPVTGGACWIYDPVAMTWQECDAVANRRAYHSVAVLLPDGRVVTAGNECPADTTYEVFSPPYLFASDGSLAPRPQITNAPAQVHFGQTFTIDTPTPAAVAKVVFVRPMAVTHQTDSEQRVVQLQFSVSGATSLSAIAPDGWYPHGLAPRGWYMLFLVDASGVPSVARFVHLH